MSFLAMSSQGQKIQLESGFHSLGPTSRSRSPVKNVFRPLTIERSQSSDCRSNHIYENHSVTSTLPSSLHYREPCRIGEFRFSKDLDALSLLVKDGPQVPMMAPRSPPMNGLAQRKCQISDDEDIQSIRKALQTAKSSWKLKNEKITELLCERELELEALKRERASIEEERKKYEATLKKKDREIEQLKERVRSMILPEITSDTSGTVQVPERPSRTSSPIDEGARFGVSLDGSMLNGMNFGGQDNSTDGDLQKTAMDSMKRILSEKQGMLREKASLQKTARQELDTAEERLLLLKEEYEDLISSPYYRTRDFFNETQGLNTEITKLENQVEEKKLALLDVTHILDGLQEFCESMEGALTYLESMTENGTPDEHYWNIHDPLINVSLEEASWYWGDINKEQTYSLLAHKPSGYFIVRNSTTQPGNYVLSVKVNVGVDENKINDVLMVHIKCIDGKFGFFKSKSQFASISELISYYMHHPLTELNPSLVTNLKAPLSRFTNSMPRSTLSLAQSADSPFTARKQGYYKYMDENQSSQLRDSVELPDLLDHLSDLTPLWEVIGYGLGVSDVVKSLRCSEKDPRTKCLMMLEEWIERGQDNTWSKLLEVLSRNQLNSTVVKLQRVKSPSSC